MVKSLAKEAITESSIVDGGAIVVEDIKWGSTDEQAVLRNAQRAIEDMMDIAPQSRIREGLTLTYTTSTLELAAGRGLVNGRWIRVAAQQDFAPADMLSGAGMADSGARLVGIWVEEEADNFTADGNDRDVDNELLYLWEDADDVDPPDNVLLIAHITRDGSDNVTAVTNFNNVNYPEIRGNDITPLANQSVRIKDYRGIVLASFASGSVVFGDGSSEVVDATFPNDVDVVNDLTVGNDLVVNNDTTVQDIAVQGNAAVNGTVDTIDVANHTHDGSAGDGEKIDHDDLIGDGTSTHAQIDTHLGSSSNPHSVTDAQILTNQGDYFLIGVMPFDLLNTVGSSTANTSWTAIPAVARFLNISQFQHLSGGSYRVKFYIEGKINNASGIGYYDIREGGGSSVDEIQFLGSLTTDKTIMVSSSFIDLSAHEDELFSLQHKVNNGAYTTTFYGWGVLIYGQLT